jgi:hypothetical protein
MVRQILATGFAAALCASLCACAASATAPSPHPAAGQTVEGLPPLASLDALHAPSGLVDRQIPVTEAYDERNTSVGLGLLNFFAGAETSYAIFQVSVADAELLSLHAEGLGSLWVLAADFGRSCWALPTCLGDGPVELDLMQLADGISPAEYFYCAVVQGGEPNPGGDFLTGLTLSYNLDLPAPVTWYVAPPAAGGDDDNPGTEAEPWATLQHAADMVGPGDTVLAQAGDYQGFMLETSGAPSHPITFDGQGVARIISDNPTTPDGINLEDWGEGAIHHVTVRGFIVIGCTRAGIRFSGSVDEHAHHITIEDNQCDLSGRWGIFCGFNDDIVVQDNECSRSADEHGIYLSNSCRRYVLRANTCWGNNGCGIHNNGDLAAGGDGIMHEGLIEYNVCYGNGAGGGSALNFDTVHDSIIRGNLAYGNHSSGISLYSTSGLGSLRNVVVNNTVIQPDDGRWCLNINSASTHNRVANNCLYSLHSFRGVITISGDSLEGFESDYNTVMDRFEIDEAGILTLADWQTATGQDQNSFTATPIELFENPAVQDFHLRESSPAIDAGIDFGIEISPMPPYDLDGDFRPLGPAYDIGADERE